MKKRMIATEKKNTFVCLSAFVKRTTKTLRSVFGKTHLCVFASQQKKNTFMCFYWPYNQPLCVQRRALKHSQTHIHVFSMCLEFLLCGETIYRYKFVWEVRHALRLGTRTDLQKHTGCNRLSLFFGLPARWPFDKGETVVVEHPGQATQKSDNLLQPVRFCKSILVPRPKACRTSQTNQTLL